MNAREPATAALEAEPADTTDTQQYNVPGLERGLRVLSAFSGADCELDAPELSRRLDVPRTTMFRLLQTLECLGYLERAPSGRGFRLGIGVLRLGFEHLSGQDMTDLAMPLLEALRDETGCAAHLVIRDGRDVVFVARAQSFVRASSAVKIEVGSRLPAHASTHGHLLMGDLTRDELVALYPEPQLQRYTPHTPGTVAELYEQVRHDSARGFAIGESTFEYGISVVSAPARNSEGRIVAVVSITVPNSRIAQTLLDSGIVERVRHAAQGLSARLNYRARQAARGGSYQ